MKNLYLQEQRFEVRSDEDMNKQKEGFNPRLVCFSDTEVYESDLTTKTEVYRNGLKLYGKCISKIYIDDKKGKNTKVIGYVFQKTEYYEDTKEPFTCETWITIHTKEPKKSIKYFYA